MKSTNSKIRKVILTLIFGLMISHSASAQVFVLEENKNRENVTPNTFGELEAPNMDTGQDHLFVPVGSGSLLLMALGGAYLLGKKRK